MIRTNPFNEIYKKCDNGDAFEKILKLSDFPDIIDIELTNTCNFRCLFCPTGTKSIQRNQGFMIDEVFYKIIEETKNYNTAMRFIRWGEPTLHPKFIEYLKYIKQVSDSIVHVNTNGSILSDEMMKQFVDIPLDSVKFSFQGVDKKSYQEMRNNNLYDNINKNIKKMNVVRGNNKLPYIHVSTSVTYESAEQIDRFKKEIKNYADLVTVGRTIMEYIDIDKVKLSESEKHILQKLKKEESVVKEHPAICPEVYNKLSINWDGTVTACCGDYNGKMIIGDINKQSLKEIWNCSKMKNYRKKLAEKKFDDFELCRTCYDYAGLTKKNIQKL